MWNSCIVIIVENEITKNLNREQREAVEVTKGPVLVIAGPGSGKTRVIEYRVLNLIRSGVDPRKILLLTFTKRAAREMLARAASHDERCALVEGGTFHSFAYKLLRVFGGELGLKKTLSVLDEGDAEELIGKIVNSFDLKEKREAFPKKDTLKNIFSLSVNKGLDLADVVGRYFSHLADFVPEVEAIFERYQLRKKESGYVDFDDLLLYARDLLMLKKTGEAIASRYEYVMVDEFQDTNPVQGDLTHLLGKRTGNVLAVGDDAQSIYGFRGASHKNIMDFPEYFPGTKLIKLEENYRSTQSILNLSNELLANMADKFKKELVSAKGKTGEKPKLLYFGNVADETEWIAEKVIALASGGTTLKEQAVLFRSTYVSIMLQAELSKMRIPYKVFGGLRFYETAHVKDFLAFAKVIANHKDEISWGRILNLLPGVGKKTAESLWEKVGGANDLDRALPILEAAGLTGRNGGGILKLKEAIADASRLKNNPFNLLARIMDFYLPIFREKFDDWPSRLQDLETIKDLAEEYHELDAFLADLSIDIPEGRDENEEEFLTLSTIHSAKGLEWNTVYLLGVSEGTLPSKRSMDFDEDIEEEGRLLYVAVTRAKERLYLFFHLDDGRSAYFGNRISRFLEPANVFSALSHEDLSGYGLKDEVRYSDEDEGIEFE